MYVPARATLAAREGARMAEGSSGGRIPFWWSVAVVVILLALVPGRAAALARQADD